MLKTEFIKAHYSAFSEYSYQKHFESFLAEYSVRVSGGHNDRSTLVQKIFRTVYRDFSRIVKTGNKRVAARFVSTYLLDFIKSKKRNANSGILRQRSADDLTLAVLDLLL